jgi:hypothetical protein
MRYNYFDFQDRWEEALVRLNAKLVALGFEVRFSVKPQVFFVDFFKSVIYVNWDFCGEVQDKYITAVSLALGYFETGLYVRSKLARKPWARTRFIYRVCRCRTPKRQAKRAWLWAELFLAEYFHGVLPPVVGRLKRSYLESI